MKKESPMVTQTFFASGKLMFFGEYLVLCGAKSLSVPLKMGQTLTVKPSKNDTITWKSFSPTGSWFEAEFSSEFLILNTTDQNVAERLQQIFRAIKTLGSQVDFAVDFEISADFNLEWGFGSSSTLISCMSQWANVDGQELLQQTFGGSGYDVACGVATSPIIYTMNFPVENVQLNKEITDKILFVYLGSKQNSRNEIGRFKKENVTAENVQKINEIVDKSIRCTSIECFEELVDASEEMLAPILGRSAIKQELFDDYPYSIKSMGAWGGDFFLATYRDLEKAKAYFQKQGHQTMFSCNEIRRKL